MLAQIEEPEQSNKGFGGRLKGSTKESKKETAKKSLAKTMMTERLKAAQIAAREAGKAHVPRGTF